ncbi:predicted protein [Lichtheimia corymbifera JMRC:FSU:9682]|uniref:Uncharacterized protein n=1 Tax=Lichtheimia corymbifera JMRC:FSU:9682 TaxID=1263082 RepID=A0A068RZY6_9FUNG|nr:predicted protein [Lichtheimia corymbifera JMRC:FSU:9682]
MVLNIQNLQGVAKAEQLDLRQLSKDTMNMAFAGTDRGIVQMAVSCYGACHCRKSQQSRQDVQQRVYIGLYARGRVEDDENSQGLCHDYRSP